MAWVTQGEDGDLLGRQGSGAKGAIGAESAGEAGLAGRLSSGEDEGCSR